MVIFEIQITVEFVPELGWRNVLTHVVVKFEFLACEGIDEGGDELEES